MARPGALSRTASDYGHAQIKMIWPDRSDGQPSGPIGNQRYFCSTEILPHRYRWFSGGIGSGKTIAGAQMLCEFALAHPGQTSLVVAQSLPMLRKVQLREIRRAARRIASANSMPGLFTENRQEMSLTWINGHVTFYMGAVDPDAFRGQTVSYIWCDEIYTWGDPDYCLQVLRGRLREPSSDHESYLVVTSTPAGRRGPILRWDAHCKTQIAPGVFVGSGEYRHYLYVKMKTRENTAADREWLRDVSHSFDAKFAAQELDAELVDLKGHVFSDVFTHAQYPLGNIVHGWQFDPSIHELWVSIDWGPVYPHVLFVAHDPHADETDDQLYDVVFDELCHEGLRDEEIPGMIQNYADAHGWKLRGLTPDPRGREQNRLLAKTFGHSRIKKAAPESREDRIRYGVWMLRGRLLLPGGVRRLAFTAELCQAPQNISPDGRGIIQSLTNCDWERDRQGHIKEAVKEDHYLIHGADCLRYYIVNQYRTGGSGYSLH